MNIGQIRQSDTAFLSPNDVAEVLGCGPQNLRDQARNRPDLLGFPVTVIGNRTLIPRKPFIAFVDGVNEEK